MVANLQDLPRPCYSVEKYFTLEKAGEARYEYWDIAEVLPGFANRSSRHTRHTTWVALEICGLTSKLEFPQFQCEITLSDTYEGVTFP